MAEKNRTQAIFDAFDRLSSREKIMVGSLVCAFILTISVVMWMVVGGQIDALEQRNESMRSTLAQVNALKGDYLEQKAKLDAIRERLENNPIRLVRLMETEAGHQGIEIEDFKESKRFLTNKSRQFQKRGNTDKSTKTVKELVEESQTVTIRRVTLDQVSSFMAALENRKEPVKVTKLTISTLNSDRQVLREIRMTVSTYRYEEVEI